MDIFKFFDFLKSISMPVLLALAVSGLILRFGPPIHGTEVVKAWPYFTTGVIVFTVLAAIRLFETVGGSYFRCKQEMVQNSLVFTVNSQLHLTWWGCTSVNGCEQTQLTIHIEAYNPTIRPLKINVVRLIAPKKPIQDIQPIVYAVKNHHDRYASVSNVIGSGDTAGVHVTIIVAGRLANDGDMLPVKIGLTDQNNREYQVNVRLWPTPSPAIPQTA